jgi:muramoyltetrapeptide carboxypeptidase
LAKNCIVAHKLNRKGNAEGELVGGNLSILYALSGSISDINTNDKILFIEDLDEYLYHIDRMMMNLKRSGKLSYLKALIVGGMSDMKDNTVPFGKTAEEIIAEHVEEYSYPVCFGFPAGHIKNNYALKMGAIAKLNIADVCSFEQ